MAASQAGLCKWADCQEPATVKATFCEAHAALSAKKLREAKSISGFIVWLTSNVSVGVLSSLVWTGLQEAGRTGLAAPETVERVMTLLSRLLAPAEIGHRGVTAAGDLENAIERHRA